MYAVGLNKIFALSYVACLVAASGTSVGFIVPVWSLLSQPVLAGNPSATTLHFISLSHCDILQVLPHYFTSLGQPLLIFANYDTSI